jgi:hypothetical protein
VRNATARAAVTADEAAIAIGDKVHEGGKKLGESLPDELAKPSPAVQEGEKGEVRKIAEEGWHQATIAAKGLADAAATIGGSISSNAHKAIEHNYGTEADRVAQGVYLLLSKGTDRSVLHRTVGTARVGLEELTIRCRTGWRQHWLGGLVCWQGDQCRDARQQCRSRR